MKVLVYRVPYKVSVDFEVKEFDVEDVRKAFGLQLAKMNYAQVSSEIKITLTDTHIIYFLEAAPLPHSRAGEVH